MIPLGSDVAARKSVSPLVVDDPFLCHIRLIQYPDFDVISQGARILHVPQRDAINGVADCCSFSCRHLFVILDGQLKLEYLLVLPNSVATFSEGSSTVMDMSLTFVQPHISPSTSTLTAVSLYSLLLAPRLRPSGFCVTLPVVSFLFVRSACFFGYSAFLST
jgi:hypothetical protein